VLTALHDIFKNAHLTPNVQPEHAPYHGYQAGDKIHDHDEALSYVLEHHSDCLPSYAQLPAEQRRSIRFSQAKIGFNHGWLVQAEAPPGALFSRFKHIIQHERVAKTDVAFYFVHWLTDLAGAEPTPLHGSSKFVQRFPHTVLASFISSFGIVNELALKSEVSIFEEYLLQQWAAIEGIGPTPTGETAIALMRLVVQVQQDHLQKKLVAAFHELNSDDLAVLASEMAFTSVANQSYSDQYGSKNVKGFGPAFLIYYSPAFLRHAGANDMLAALATLAEIYRQARSMWPLSATHVSKCVTVRIDQIKDQAVDTIIDGHVNGDCWLLCKHNEQEAVIELHPLYALTSGTLTNTRDFRLLAFWRHDDADDDLIDELELMRRAQMTRR